MSLDVDTNIYRSDDPRASRTRISYARGANHISVWHPRLLSLAKTHVKSFFTMSVMGVFITATYVGQGFLLAIILRDVVIGANPTGIAKPILGVAALVAVRALLFLVRETLGARVATAMAAELREKLFHRLIDLGPGWVNATRQGALQSSFTTSVEALQRYFQEFLAQAVVSFIGMVVITFILAFIDPVVGFFVFITALVGANGHVIMWHMLGPRLRFWWVEAPALTAEYMETLRGMPVFKAMGVVRRQRDRISERAHAMRNASMGVLRVEVLGGTPGLLFLIAGMLLTSVIASLRSWTGHLSAFELFIVLVLARECFRPIQELRRVIHFSYQGIAGAERIFDILDAEPLIHQETENVVRSQRGHEDTIIQFKDVSFKYPTGTEDALHDIKFDIQRNKTIAIVGSSGSGKSTLAYLLMHFMEQDSGRIVVDGLPSSSYDISDYHSKFALVSQNPYLFHGTIRDNLLIAKPDASDADMSAACAAAHIGDFIAKLPKGLDTLVGERGSMLSGGQRQRISLARALLKNAPVLVLDEATSSVDAQNEGLIQKSLEEISRNRTCIIIAHRLSTIKKADNIIVLERGQIVESGTHADLVLLDDGHYRALFEAQVEESM